MPVKEVARSISACVGSDEIQAGVTVGSGVSVAAGTSEGGTTVFVGAAVGLGAFPHALIMKTMERMAKNFVFMFRSKKKIFESIARHIKKPGHYAKLFSLISAYSLLYPKNIFTLISERNVICSFFSFAFASAAWMRAMPA